MAQAKILIQLDADKHASCFDRIVAIDAGADHVLAYSNVKAADVMPLVHGAMFTRSEPDLKNTAIFIGGSDVEAGEKLLSHVVRTFFGTLRVSVMMDANGSNTTAVAAVLAARKHLDLAKTTALVLGGSGPVGQRAARLLAQEGAQVRLASRSYQRATKISQRINDVMQQQRITPCETSDQKTTHEALDGAELVIAAGAAGVQLLTAPQWQGLSELKVAIDLNAIWPLGIEGVEASDEGVQREAVICYGAIGIGETKMKIHHAAIVSLFESNDKVLDADAIYALGKTL